MPHKAQLLLQLAQAAARGKLLLMLSCAGKRQTCGRFADLLSPHAAAEGRQQAARPQVAVNVWDTLAGNAISVQQVGQGPQDLGAARAAAAANDRLVSGFNLLNISKSVGQVSSTPMLNFFQDVVIVRPHVGLVRLVSSSAQHMQLL